MAQTAEMGDFAEKGNGRRRKAPKYDPAPQWVELTRAPRADSELPSLIVLQHPDGDPLIANRGEVLAIEDPESSIGDLLRPYAAHLYLYHASNN